MNAFEELLKAYPQSVFENGQKAFLIEHLKDDLEAAKGQIDELKFELEQAQEKIADLEQSLAIVHDKKAEPEQLKPEQPWYPDYSGEWIEVPAGLIGKPKELHPRDLIQSITGNDRDTEKWFRPNACDEAAGINWYCSDGSKIVAYKLIKKAEQ